MPNRPEPLRVSKAVIWAHAERVAAALRFAPGDAIEPLVAGLGGQIVYRNASPADSHPESMVARSQRDFTIFLPRMTSPARDRFTIAHELGHLFLHFPKVAHAHPGEEMVATRWVDESDPNQQRAEWEANWFGAAFLMPRAEFSKAWREIGPARAAAKFGVSDQAVGIRAKSLGL